MTARRSGPQRLHQAVLQAEGRRVHPGAVATVVGPVVTKARSAAAAVESLGVSAYTVPTDAPESDGTAEWDSTTCVVVELRAGAETGLGYTYAPPAAGELVQEKLAEIVRGSDVFAIGQTWEAMGAALRNARRPGIAVL